MQKVLFSPYTRQQMAAILEQQMQQLPGPVFEPMALRLCAAKVLEPARLQGSLTILHSWSAPLGIHPAQLSSSTCVGCCQRTCWVSHQSRMSLHCRLNQMADNHGDVRKALSTCEAALDMLADDSVNADETAGTAT